LKDVDFFVSCSAIQQFGDGGSGGRSVPLVLLSVGLDVGSIGDLERRLVKSVVWSVVLHSRGRVLSVHQGGSRFRR
jgi:hypothetical protein